VSTAHDRLYLGADPGKSGGLAAVDADGDLLYVYPFAHGTEHDAWDWLRAAVLRARKVHAALERVHAMPKQGVASTFAFGRHYGFLRGLLVAAGVPFVEVAPRKWQAALGVAPAAAGESRARFKNRLKAAAQRLFPKEHITLATADAVLLAEYCRRGPGRPGAGREGRT
jgi:hypothetical protein